MKVCTLLNYTVQCADVITGKKGCFFYDPEYWIQTGKFKAVGEVYPDLDSFYKNTKPEERKSCYLERDTNK